MTLINRLIEQARSTPKPDELLVPRHRVRQVAEHARLLMHYPSVSTDDLERRILAGEMQMHGVPVRVVGRYAGDGDAG